MRKFDPLSSTGTGLFLVGFAITKFSLGLTEEDWKNSVFAQRHKS